MVARARRPARGAPHRRPTSSMNPRRSRSARCAGNGKGPSELHRDSFTPGRFARPACAIAIALAAAVALAACHRNATPPAPPPPEVGVVAAEVGAVPDRREYVGNVRAVNEVEVRARVRGYLLERRFVEGQAVAAGDVLFLIDPREYEVALQSAQGQLAQARATLVRAGHDFQ